MDRNLITQYAPDFVSPPGETLEEVLEERSMSQAQLADRTGRPKKTINEIVQGKAAITPETALQLELVLGIPARFWNVREAAYREALARERSRVQLSSQVTWLASIPHRKMAQLGWINAQPDRVSQLREVLSFFGVASVDSWHELWEGQQAAFRQSQVLQSRPGAVAAWLRQGELQAHEVACESYDSHTFREVLTAARAVTRVEQGFDQQLRKLCARAGVAVVFVPELPGTRAWGATRWLSASRAMIQLSLRYKTDDHLWFTFFHEAAHILLHGKRDVFLEGDDQAEDAKEAEADRFAGDWLLPEGSYRRFVQRRSFTETAILRFSREVGIAAGVVVGRLQHDGHVSRKRHYRLKRRLEFDSSAGV